MRKVFFFTLIFSAIKLFALSSDDFIIQQAIDNNNIRFRPKIYLGQNWGEANIKDKLIKTEIHEQWGMYKDVIVYFFENIEIATARYIPNATYRRTVQVIVTGDKYFTMSEITVGSSINDVTSIYGKPKHEQQYEGMNINIYEIDDLHSEYSELQAYRIGFIHKDGVVKKIRVSYAYSI